MKDTPYHFVARSHMISNSALFYYYYLITTAFGLFPGRVTYVLDKDGVCVKVYDELADAASHVDVAKEALSQIKTSAKPANPLAGLFK